VRQGKDAPPVDRMPEPLNRASDHSKYESNEVMRASGGSDADRRVVVDSDGAQRAGRRWIALAGHGDLVRH
jgi:hypothetical protein